MKKFLGARNWRARRADPTAMLMLTRVLEALLDLAAPRGCAACDAALGTQARSPFCAVCAPSLEPERAEGSFAGVPAFAIAPYGPPLSTAVLRLKHAGRVDLAVPLARELLRRAPELAAGRGTLLVPVPLHEKRLAERGYNQSCLIARALAASTGARTAPRALRRLRDTPRQATLGRAERLSNVDGTLVARWPDRLEGAKIVLVDDVVTTGATAEAAIGALRRAGARVAAVAALALTSAPNHARGC